MHSKKVKNGCRRYCSRISKPKVEIIVEIMKQECKGDGQVKEVVEWMGKRGSKGKRESGKFYKRTTTQ